MKSLLLYSFLLQTEGSVLLKSGKIWSVLAVVSVIFVAFIIMLIRMEIKTKKLEKNMK
jgi:hypothetical protein